MKPQTNQLKVKEHKHRIGLKSCAIYHYDKGDYGKCIDCYEWIPSNQLDKYEHVNKI